MTLAALAWMVSEIEALDPTRPLDPYLYLPLAIMAALTVAMAVYFYRRAPWARLQAELLAVEVHEDALAMATARVRRSAAAPSLDDDGATWTRYRFSDLAEVRHYGGTGIQLVPKSHPPVMLPTSSRATASYSRGSGRHGAFARCRAGGTGDS